MKHNKWLLAITIFLVTGISGCLDPPMDEDPLQQTYNYALNPKTKNDVLFQTSTIDALVKGIYDGHMTLKDVKDHGDFGIGTFNGLDGEMLEINGDVYQIKADGVAYSVDDLMKTPFAIVTFFEPDQVISIDVSVDKKIFEDYLETIFPSKNIMYAIKIKGDFDYMKTGSVPKLTRPYPRLSDAAQNQIRFEFHNVSGTIIGFWFPDYMNGLNEPGYHFHFITEDRKAGGHVLEYQSKNLVVEIDHTFEFLLELPENDDFYLADLTKDNQAELDLEEE